MGKKKEQNGFNPRNLQNGFGAQMAHPRKNACRINGNPQTGGTNVPSPVEELLLHHGNPDSRYTNKPSPENRAVLNCRAIGALSLIHI